jgi:protein CpxP
MKKTILTLMTFAIVAGIKAQDIPERRMDKPGMHHGMREHGMKGRHEKMMAMKDLNLTEQQKQQLKNNREDFRTRMEALKKEDNITVKEYRTRMETLHKDQKNAFQSVLTPDQKATIEKKRTEAKGRHEEMGRKRADMMKTRLGLSDEQASQMKKNHEEVRARIKSIREDKSLSEEKKRESIKAEMKNQKDKMNSILTEEQKNKMKEMREKKGDFKGRKPEDKKVI